MKKKNRLLFLVFLSLFFLVPFESSAKKKRRVYKKKWAISFTNGYNIRQIPNRKIGIRDPLELNNKDWGYLEGQMHVFFSSLDISRNFGYYEFGAKIQNLGPTFISPFFKWNLNKNNSRASIIPSVSLGLVPSRIMGAWLRLGLGLSWNPYVSFAPFVGTYAWYKIKEDGGRYEKWALHFNAGLSLVLYY